MNNQFFIHNSLFDSQLDLMIEEEYNKTDFYMFLSFCPSINKELIEVVDLNLTSYRKGYKIDLEKNFTLIKTEKYCLSTIYKINDCNSKRFFPENCTASLYIENHDDGTQKKMPFQKIKTIKRAEQFEIIFHRIDLFWISCPNSKLKRPSYNFKVYLTFPGEKVKIEFETNQFQIYARKSDKINPVK